MQTKYRYHAHDATIRSIAAVRSGDDPKTSSTYRIVSLDQTGLMKVFHVDPFVQKTALLKHSLTTDADQRAVKASLEQCGNGGSQ